jgi:hypothetical protein
LCLLVPAQLEISDQTESIEVGSKIFLVTTILPSSTLIGTPPTKILFIRQAETCGESI